MSSCGGGYGRGGRGAALLAALKQPTRRPGSDEGASSPGARGPPSPPAPQHENIYDVDRSTSAISTGSPVHSDSGRDSTDGRGSTSGPAPLGRGAYLRSLLSAASASGSERAASSDAASRGMTPVVGRGTSLSGTSITGASPGPHSVGASPGPHSLVSSSVGTSRTDISTPMSMRGTSGQAALLSTNHVRVRASLHHVYQYHVTFRPEVPSRPARCRLVNKLYPQAKAFDGSVLYLPEPLDSDENVNVVKRSTDNADIEIVTKLTKRLGPADSDCIKVYNVLFRRIMSILKLSPVGRRHYDPSNPSIIQQHKLEIWPGYVTAIKQQEGGLMLLCDVSHRVVRRETVLDFMSSIIQRHPHDHRAEITRQLVGATVLTRYNNRTYRVDEIDWSLDPNSSFLTSDGTAVTFKDYYSRHYHKEIMDDEQPLLIHRPRPRPASRRGGAGQVQGQSGQGQESGQGPASQEEMVCLVPELCYMSGLTDSDRKDYKVMKDLSRHARVGPEARRVYVERFVENVKTTPEAVHELQQWGLQLEDRIADIGGRKLKEETIMLGDGRQVAAGPSADWTQDALRLPQLVPANLRSWLLLCVQRDAAVVQSFLNQLPDICKINGLQLQPPRVVYLSDERTDTYISAIRQNIELGQTQLVMGVMPTRRDDRYNAFKKFCCVECPVPSQAVQSRTISDPRKLRSVAGKIMIQVNCKLGGEPWGVDILDIPLKSTMICGIDAYHEEGQQSVGAFVASISANFARYYHRAVFLTEGQELIDCLSPCMTEAIHKYHEVNGEPPHKILVYRDGVGDGQLKHVSNYEVAQLSSCFRGLGDYDPQLVVITVQKRIHERIFDDPRKPLTNPRPGTVVDSHITRRGWFDFFIVSQSVREGTVSPTHYVVVHNTSDIPPDHIQRLTYKLTHLYFNWTGTIRVPAPCQYAHKLAYLTGENIRKPAAAELSDRLFFL